MLNKLSPAVRTQVNPRGRKPTTMDDHPRGLSPKEHWELDLTEVTSTRFGYQYLLDFVDTFSKWVDTSLISSETANAVTKMLLICCPPPRIPTKGRPQTIEAAN